MTNYSKNPDPLPPMSSKALRSYARDVEWEFRRAARLGNVDLTYWRIRRQQVRAQLSKEQAR